MLSDNIRSNRKKNNMSQDELAEKLGVSRQSVSFWETGQTQPTIDNIIALSKVFNVSPDALLSDGDNANVSQNNASENLKPKNSKAGLIIVICILIVAIIGAAIFAFPMIKDYFGDNNLGSDKKSSSIKGDVSDSSDEEFDLFSYCKNFAIEKGELNGDYCIYQEPAAKYGGYDNEYFSISYWGDSDMVEFCLHCPLSETQSHNFYIRMRGGYNQKYEYLSSKYYRETGESIRSAAGYIDPAVFSDSYPIGCDEYVGSVEGQTEFMEESRKSLIL